MTDAKIRANKNWYERNKTNPDFLERVKATKRRYYAKNKKEQNKKALERYYNKRYDKGEQVVWYIDDIVKFFKIQKREAQALGSLLGVPKPLGHFIFTRRYINMIKWVIRFREL